MKVRMLGVKNLLQWICLVPLCLSLFPLNSHAASVSDYPLTKAKINVYDKVSLQRGAKLYINYCLGCHSLYYLRYNRMAKDIGIVDATGAIEKKVVKDNLIFTNDRISDPIRTSMSSADAGQWFGIPPPDLSLITRIKGADWVYTYLRSFYQDKSRLWGTNNALFRDVAMPNVLLALQGTQVPVYREVLRAYNGQEKKVNIIDQLVLSKKGAMSPAQFNAAVNDIVNFLAYAAEPAKIKRERMGVWVLLFLVIFTVIAYLLQKEFWKDVKK